MKNVHCDFVDCIFDQFEDNFFLAVLLTVNHKIMLDLIRCFFCNYCGVSYSCFVLTVNLWVVVHMLH